MKRFANTAFKTTAGLSLALLSLGAFAHDGHGQAAASHWHATDTLGLLLVAVLAVGALWLGRRK